MEKRFSALFSKGNETVYTINLAVEIKCIVSNSKENKKHSI